MILYSLSSISFPDLRLHHLEVEALQAEWGWRFSTNGPPQGVFRLVTCGPPKNMCAACRIIAPSQHLATSKHIDVTMDEKLENTPNCYKVYIYILISIYLSQKMQGRNHDCSWENKSHSPVFVCLPFWIFLDLWRGSGLQKWRLLGNVGWENPEVEDGFCGDFLRRDGIFRFFWRWNFQFFLFQDFVKCFDQIIVSVGADV